MPVGNNAWGPLRFDLLSTDMYTNVTPNEMQELGELSKNVSSQGRFRASGGDFVKILLISGLNFRCDLLDSARF